MTTLAVACRILLDVPPDALPASALDADAPDVARFRAGDDQAFEALVCRREAEVYRLALRLLGNPDDALDAVQETFLRVFRSLRGFRGEATFRTWLTGIALNVCRNKRSSAATRRSQRSQQLEREDPATGQSVELELPDPRPDPESSAYGSELRQALERALGRLAPEHREVILLREMQGLEYEELSQVLACPSGTVKSRLNRARAALRAAMEDVWP